MIPLTQLPQRTFKSPSLQAQVGPFATTIVLALIICFQIALLVLVFVKRWS